VSDFELKISQSVRFWIKFFTDHQICNKYFSSKNQILQKSYASKKSRFDSFYPFKTTNFVICVQFHNAQFWRYFFEKKSDFYSKNLRRVRSKKKIDSVPDFELKNSQRVILWILKNLQGVRFWIENFTICPIGKKNLQRVRFWIKFFHHVSDFE